ncbi:MAG: hypothetical protein ACREGH_04300 [Minisyncoccia bacterium]
MNVATSRPDYGTPLSEQLIIKPVEGKFQLVRYGNNTLFEEIGTLIAFDPPKVSWYVEGEVRYTFETTAEVNRGVDGEIELYFGDDLVIKVRHLVPYQRARVAL